jgi:hypothetical protein
MSRFDREVERYAPDWMSPALAPSLDAQNYDLDWGDIRNVKLTYRPVSGWTVSGAYMYGKTNGQSRQGAYEDVPGLTVPALFGGGTKYVDQVDNYAVTAVHDSEEFAIVDFKVGTDVGLGVFSADGTSTLAAGLRYASLQSNSSVATGGIGGSYIAPNLTALSGVKSHDVYSKVSLDSRRKFEGAGPSVSWDASVRLLGDDNGGHADIDWAVGAAVLFGKQTVGNQEARSAVHYLSTGGSSAKYVATPLYNVITLDSRSSNVTVPNLDLSLGLSYSIDRLKVSTGYRYDRFFNAIDGGIDEARQYDRTIQGPYFKLAVGFGG